MGESQLLNSKGAEATRTLSLGIKVAGQSLHTMVLPPTLGMSGPAAQVPVPQGMRWRSVNCGLAVTGAVRRSEEDDLAVVHQHRGGRSRSSHHGIDQSYRHGSFVLPRVGGNNVFLSSVGRETLYRENRVIVQEHSCLFIGPNRLGRGGRPCVGRGIVDGAISREQRADHEVPAG
jgi:hypothetical protein